MLENFSDFYLPLMKVLDEFPGRTGQSGHVLKIIENRYGDQISPSQLEKNQRGQFYWIYNVRMCREHLRRKGFIDAPATGIWRMTEKGHKWLLEHPDAKHLTEERIHESHSGLPRRSVVPKIYRFPEKKETPPADQHRFGILNREVENIQAYLAGLSSLQPTDEKLCDWVSFCYTFEKYAEGKALFSLVSENDVNSWYYERTKKIAKVCEQKTRLG